MESFNKQYDRVNMRVLVSKRKYDKLQEYANYKGMKRSEYVRYIIDREIIEQELRKERIEKNKC